MTELTAWTTVSFVLICAVTTIRFVALCRSGKTLRGIVSMIVTLVYVLAMWVPGILQAQGRSTSKIYEQGILSLPGEGELRALTAQWTLELAVVLLSEVLALAIWDAVAARKQPKQTERPARSLPLDPAKRSFAVLFVVGIAATLLFPAPDLSDRAAGGQGVQVLLKTAITVGVALGCYHFFFRSRSYLLLVAAGATYLALGNVRSPLMVAVVAVAAGWLALERPVRVRLVLALASCVVVFALLAAYMSAMRADISRHEGMTAGNVLASTLADPLPSVYESGVDTLDGYRFAQSIDAREPAHLSDLATVLTTFVPRSIWPNKPTDLTVAISAKYLNYGASGQFLSAVGYLRLLTGNYTFALIGLFLVVFLFATLVQLTKRSFLLAVVLTVVIRFFLGGAAFDIYYGATLALLYAAARFVALHGPTLVKTKKSGNSIHSAISRPSRM